MSTEDALLKRAEALIEEAKNLPPPTIKVVKTKVLKMYYVDLPVVDLTHRFMYRFDEPVATVWRKGGISHALIGGPFNKADSLKEYGLQQWFKMATSGMRGPLPEGAQWLLEVDSCELIECEIVPKMLTK